MGLKHQVGFGYVEIKDRACELARRAGAKAQRKQTQGVNKSKESKWPHWKPHKGALGEIILGMSFEAKLWVTLVHPNSIPPSSLLYGMNSHSWMNAKFIFFVPQYLRQQQDIWCSKRSF